MRGFGVTLAQQQLHFHFTLSEDSVWRLFAPSSHEKKTLNVPPECSSDDMNPNQRFQFRISLFV